MKFNATSLADAMLIELEPRGDERGFFARTFCAAEFAAHGLETGFVQGNCSYNRGRGTVRGLHWQRAPHAEVKLVRVVQGAIFDAIVDLRPASPSYLKWAGFELSAANRRSLYVPAGFAHGLQTLEDETHVVYQVSHPFTPGAERGMRWDDPAVGIAWPLPVASLSEKDAGWPRLDPAAGIPI
jgi:dTDP-4-dehydrorhamnose 3,5-epimerase